MTRLASGTALVTVVDGGVHGPDAEGRVLDAWFPDPVLVPPNGDPEALAAASDLPAQLAPLVVTDTARGVRREVRTVVADLDAPPADSPDAYLRLHLLSLRLARPRELNVDGIFDVLANVVWTSFGPCPAEGFPMTRLRLMNAHEGTRPSVHGVDKFPRMTDYVVPTGVRVADADRVRLGAHLAEGTTVMHEGFVNFNAGTLGPSMVEGRVSAGVVIGAGTDIGGGASIMGTLSGGGEEIISLGERCLVGANAGLGISLGADCVVEAGLYMTAATKVALLPGAIEGVHTSKLVKASELSGASGLLFRRNSVSGQVEGLARTGVGVALNPSLHAN